MPSFRDSDLELVDLFPEPARKLHLDKFPTRIELGGEDAVVDIHDEFLHALLGEDEHGIRMFEKCGFNQVLPYIANLSGTRGLA